MAIERVREYFKQWGLENRIMEFDVSSATVELAAQALPPAWADRQNPFFSVRGAVYFDCRRR